MKNLAIARRYAKALMLIGKADGNAETYRDELERVTGLITGNSDLELAITNPLYEAAGRKKVLKSVVEKLTLSEVMRA